MRGERSFPLRQDQALDTMQRTQPLNLPGMLGPALFCGLIRVHLCPSVAKLFPSAFPGVLRGELFLWEHVQTNGKSCPLSQAVFCAAA